MYTRPLVMTCALAVCFCNVSCSRAKGNTPKIKDKVPLTKVSGKVLVDGTETSGVIVSYKPKGDIPEKREMFVRGFVVRSTAKGKFTLKTYELGDGVPAGEYQMFFEYYPAEGEDPRRTAPKDVLGGQYSNKNNPGKVIKVAEGAPLDLGSIELKTLAKK